MEPYRQLSAFEKVSVFLAVVLMFSAGFVSEASATEAPPPIYTASQGACGPMYGTAGAVASAVLACLIQNLNETAAEGTSYSIGSGPTLTCWNTTTDPCSSYYVAYDIRLSYDGGFQDTDGNFSAPLSECPEGTSLNLVTGLCEEPPDGEPNSCSAEGGAPTQKGLFVQGSSVPAVACFGGCQYHHAGGVSVCLGAGCYGTFNLDDGITCTGAPAQGDDDPCFMSDGVTFCSEGPTNCGEINGEYVCLDDVPEGDCVIIADGSYICDSEASNQPTTPDGTTPAAPDATGTDADGDPWNYYGEGTVGDSGSPVSGDPAPDEWSSGGGDGSGDDGSGDDGGTCDPLVEECGPGDGEASGGATCDVPPTCSGDPIQCAILEQSWQQRCGDFTATDAEILSAAGLTPVEAGGFAAVPDVDLSNALDDSGYGWSRQCFPDKVIAIPQFGEVTIPLSQLCWLFQLIGTFVVMAAGYTSYRIVLGASK